MNSKAVLGGGGGGGGGAGPGQKEIGRWGEGIALLQHSTRLDDLTNFTYYLLLL